MKWLFALVKLLVIRMVHTGSCKVMHCQAKTARSRKLFLYSTAGGKLALNPNVTRSIAASQKALFSFFFISSPAFRLSCKSLIKRVTKAAAAAEEENPFVCGPRWLLALRRRRSMRALIAGRKRWTWSQGGIGAALVAHMQNRNQNGK